MAEPKSNRIILTAAMVTLASTTGASFMPEKYCGRGELPSPRLLFGTSITFAGLSILGDFIPKIASMISLSIALTALTYYGVPVLDAAFTGKECKPVNNGRNGKNTFPLPTTGAGSGGEFPPVAPPPGQAGVIIPNPGGGNRPATPSF